MDTKLPDGQPQGKILPSSHNLQSPSLKLYLRHLATSGYSKRTINRYGVALELFLGYFDHRDPAEITADMMDEFFEDIRVKRSAATVNLSKSAIRGFYQFLMETEKITKDQSWLVKNEKVVRKSPPVFSKEQRNLLLDTIAARIGVRPKFGPMRDWMMFSLAYNAGLRVAELVQVNIEDVEQKQTLELIGKGQKLARIPLNSSVQVSLRRYLPWRKALKVTDGKALFVNRFGGRISTRAVEMILKRWLEKAKIEGNLTPHSLRHAFSTDILRATKNIRTTQEASRHKHVSTTQIYTHVVDEEIRSAVESLAND